MNPEIENLEMIAGRLRGAIIETSHRSRAAHLGSCLSCVDILTALYWNVLRIDPKNPDDPNRDRFILSKGHAANALFNTLAAKGFFPVSDLDDFCQPGCKLEEHPGPGCAPGVEAATGSLGHGLPIAVGMALAARLQKLSYRVVALLGDGECNEGTVWEAAMFAAGRKLNNLMVIVDFNKWQATGRSCEITALESLSEKWKAFGWQAYETDGHNMNELLEVLSEFPDKSGRPVAIVAHTVKGKGASFMEDDNNWHYRIPDSAEVLRAKEELGLL